MREDGLAGRWLAHQDGVVLLLLATALLGAACTGGNADITRFTSVDSAGITVADSRSPRWGHARLDDRAFELGRASGPDHLLFDRIRGVVRLEGGAIAVGNQGTSSIRVLDESGLLVDELAGRGEGPGELTLLRGVRRCRPGVLVALDYDWRVTHFTESGDFLDSWTMTLPGDRFGVYEMACNGEARIAALGWGDAGLLDHPVGTYRAQAPLYVADGPAGPFEAVGTTSLDDRSRLPKGEHPHPFGRRAVLAGTADGFVLGTADAYELAVLSARGDTTMLVRWAGPERPLREAHVAAYLASRLSEVAEADHPAVRREVEQFEMPDALPAYGSVEVAPSGVIWVGEFTRPWQPASHWWGFLPSGEWAWELELEPDFRVVEFGVDEVLGVATDELGIEVVRGYRLVLPRGEG